MRAPGDLHILSNAKNPVILGGTFTNITNPTNSKVNGFQLLLDNISDGAFHNAADRGDPPRCHPRTRIAIRAEIMEWVASPLSMRKLVLWMYGPAGSGKTAIAQSIAEECERLGILAASFFFWRSAVGRNDATRFIPTLAYQLSRYIPQIEEHLIAAIERDPTIFSRSLSTQMRMLVIDPLKLAAPSLPIPIAAIVDGVDECGPNGRAQADLLHAIGSIASELQHLPLVFLVTSRPEFEIREAFNGSHLSPMIRALVLNDSYEPDKDINVYFDLTFREIYDKNLRLGSHLPSPWPTTSDINFLVSKASGQFIFATTVTKFVDSPRHNPADRLKIITHLSTLGNETPYAQLDALYRFILDSVADIKKVLEILTFLLLVERTERLTLATVETLLGFDIRMALVDMHALLFVPPPADNNLPRIYHASLPDFLMDRSRSLEYFIDQSCGHAFLARRWLKSIGTYARSRISTMLAIRTFVHHCTNLYPPANQELLDDLACFGLREFLEGISEFGPYLYWPQWHRFMQCVETQGGGRDDVFPRLQKDFDTFILDRIGRYPPLLQPYIATLLSQGNGSWDTFNVVVHAVGILPDQLYRLHELDERLLDLPSASTMSSEHYISNLLHDAARAGQHFVDSGSYAVLAKAIVKVIYSQPGERSYQITFRGRDDVLGEHDSDSTIVSIGAVLDPELSWFETILDKASIDLDLAALLRERTVQFRNDVEPTPGRNTIAKASVKYIQRCGIPFLEHTHQLQTNECAICAMCEDAVIVKNISQISIQLPPRPPPISEFGVACIKSDLTYADVFDITSYPFRHTLRFFTIFERRAQNFLCWK